MYSYGKILEDLTVTIKRIIEPEYGIQVLIGKTEIMGIDGNQNEIGEAISDHFQKLIIPLKETKDAQERFFLLVEFECSLKDFIQTANDPLIQDFGFHSEDENEDEVYSISDLLHQYFDDDYPEFKDKIKRIVRNTSYRLLHVIQKKISIHQNCHSMGSINTNISFEFIPDIIEFDGGPFDLRYQAEEKIKNAYNYFGKINFIKCGESDLFDFFKGNRIKNKLIICEGSYTFFALFLKELAKPDNSYAVYINSSNNKPDDYWDYVIKRTCDEKGGTLNIKSLRGSHYKETLCKKSYKKYVTETLKLLKTIS